MTISFSIGIGLAAHSKTDKKKVSVLPECLGSYSRLIWLESEGRLQEVLQTHQTLSMWSFLLRKYKRGLNESRLSRRQGDGLVFFVLEARELRLQHPIKLM